MRNELAGVLLGSKQAATAALLFASPPQDFDGALLLTKARFLTGDYLAAEKDARLLLDRRPQDVDIGLLLLNSLAGQGKLAAARDLGQG